MAVFLSYAEEDSALVHRVHDILFRMGLDPYAFKLYPEPGEFVPQLVLKRIETADYFIPFLTRHGVTSQWVNQEIGIAHALNKYIIPIKVRSVTSKGFVELRHHITHDPTQPENTIHDIIYRLVQLANVKSIDAQCSACGNKFVTNMANILLVNELIKDGQILHTACPMCEKQVLFNPKTQEIIS